MNKALIQELIQTTLTRKIPFPDVLATLKNEAVESYHVDFLRNEVRYYAKSGDSFVIEVAFEHKTAPRRNFQRKGLRRSIGACNQDRRHTRILSGKALRPDAPTTSCI